jgi:hypothetical protein
MIHVVGYDLIAPNNRPEDYSRVIAAIKAAFNSWCHIEESVWIVDAPLDAASVRDHLKPYLHQGDRLFVARLQGNWATLNCGDMRNNWLKSRLVST